MHNLYNFLIPLDLAVITNLACQEAFVAACVEVRNILHILKKMRVTEHDLWRLDRAAKQLGPLLTDAQKDLPDKKKVNLNIPKIHSVLHFR